MFLLASVMHHVSILSMHYLQKRVSVFLRRMLPCSNVHKCCRVSNLLIEMHMSTGFSPATIHNMIIHNIILSLDGRAWCVKLSLGLCLSSNLGELIQVKIYTSIYINTEQDIFHSESTGELQIML